MTVTDTRTPRLVRNRWTGLIGHLNRDLEDGRSLELVHVEDLPLPLLYSEPGADYYLSEVRGAIELVEAKPDGTIRAEGWTTLPVGTYPVGMDLGQLALGRGEDPLRGMRGTLLAITAADADVVGAWPDALITVVPA